MDSLSIQIDKYENVYKYRLTAAMDLMDDVCLRPSLRGKNKKYYTRFIGISTFTADWIWMLDSPVVTVESLGKQDGPYQIKELLGTIIIYVEQEGGEGVKNWQKSVT